jgi:hypothetical protein
MHRSPPWGVPVDLSTTARRERLEGESVLMSHGALADVAVHVVTSQLSEDDLRLTAVLQANPRFSAAELSEWCVTRLPSFALPLRTPWTSRRQASSTSVDSGSSVLTLVGEYRRVGHHRMGDRPVPPGAVDHRINDARSSPGGCARLRMWCAPQFFARSYSSIPSTATGRSPNSLWSRAMSSSGVWVSSSDGEVLRSLTRDCLICGLGSTVPCSVARTRQIAGDGSHERSGRRPRS